MLFKACLIVVALAVSAWADECYNNAHEKCIPKNFPKDYPETVEELLRDCSIVKEMAKCYIAFFEKKCPEKENRIVVYNKILKYVDTECQEDSQNFQVLSRSIGCATSAAKSLDKACSWEEFSTEEKDNLTALVQPLWDKRIYQCPSAVQKITCASHVISKRCGSDLKCVVTNILENTEANYAECNKEYLEELLPFKECYERLLIKRDMSEDTSSEEE